MSFSLQIRHKWPDMALDIDLSAPQGITALFGPSGAGKTTIAKAVSGLFRPTLLTLKIAGQTLCDEHSFTPAHKRGVAHVFQDARLFPHMTVAQNLAYGRGAMTRWEDVIATLDIANLLHRFPMHLSGGEAQRVAIGRAVLADPKLLVLDEPLSALDRPRREAITTMLEDLRDQLGLPMLYISHSVAEIARLATTVAMVDKGRIVQVGPTSEVMSDPSLVPLIGIREMGAVLTATVGPTSKDALTCLDTSAGPLLVPALKAAKIGQEVRVRVPAQDVIVSLSPLSGISALNQLPATVQALHHQQGDGVLVQLDVGGQRLLARITDRSAKALDLRPGLICTAILKSVSVAQSAIGQTG